MPPEVKTAIGERLLEVRKKLGLTQEEMAELLNVSRTHYGSAERGRASLSLMQFIKLHDLHGVDLNHLLAGGKPSNPSNDRVTGINFEDRFDQQDRLLRYIIDLLQKRK